MMHTHTSHRQGYASALVALACLLALISGPALASLSRGPSVALAASSASAQAAQAAQAQAASTAPLLPGETLWGGVPSDLFGADTTYDYTSNGLSNNTAIQQHIASAHVPLIRATFEVVDESDHTTPISDAHQLAIAQAIHSSGAACMADLTQPLSVAQALHLVSLLAPYCQYYEVFNEPDIGAGNWPPAVSAANYLAFWNSFVPQARALDPSAAFGGPALADEFGLDNGNYMQDVLSGMAQSGVAPDFVTFHWYICAATSGQSECLSAATTSTPGHGKTVAQWIAQDFPGRHVALGITEWSADPGNPSWAYDDAFMSQFERTSLAGFEQNPYLAFATQFDLASFAGYGTLDLFRTASDEPFTNTPATDGSPRPSFGVLSGEIARLSAAGAPNPTPTPTQPPSPTATPKPSPTPTQTPPPTQGVPCFEFVNGVMTAGTCVGTFTPTSSPTPPPVTTGFVTTDGVHFLDAAGHPLALSGYTMYPATAGGTAAWRSNAIRPFIDSELTLGLSAGQNLVRPTDYWDKTNTSQTYNDPVIWGNMDYLVSQAQARHVDVLMDLSAYKWLLMSQGLDPYNANNWTTFLQFVGARYRNTPNIVAYSIVGEPPAPTTQAQADAMVAFYAQLTDTLYAADGGHHLISAGGFNHMESGTQFDWWQRIYALPHNDIAAFKTYSQHDLDVMPTIAAYAQSIHKPSLDEEFGAPQSLGDAVWSGVTWNGFSGSRAQFYTDVYQETTQYHVAADIFWNLDTLVGATHYDVSPLTPAVWSVIQAHAHA